LIVSPAVRLLGFDLSSNLAGVECLLDAFSLGFLSAT
jgi:hypothetical protein